MPPLPGVPPVLTEAPPEPVKPSVAKVPPVPGVPPPIPASRLPPVPLPLPMPLLEHAARTSIGIVKRENVNAMVMAGSWLEFARWKDRLTDTAGVQEVDRNRLCADGTIACCKVPSGAPQIGCVTPPPSGPFTVIISGNYLLRTDGTIVEFCPAGSTPPSGTFTSVSVGSTMACGVKTDGTIDCWWVAGPWG
jgi:hypothetical protein